jgi:hypothetical protein
MRHIVHRHLDLVVGAGIAALIWLVLYIVRKVFDRRKGVHLPAEDA